ncbi:sulfite exporter TauE/SafE family protein 3 isoform X3 [Triticum aestivum]|uniref:sulfite exporter TauE/SafE family protein 3 isoform X3 n=1 Tax=Triticum aestivum TaxID=4565 RepID=UPI001D029482|nr:sulfite exporter TauE/SafE family protein 3-like isoform X3 [Triticum aestivum]
MGRKWHAVAALGMAYAVAAAAVADGDKGLSFAGTVAGPEEASSPRKLASLYGTTYHHVWPPMKFGWRIVLGSFIGFFGAAFGSVGGVGGGGIFVPMLTLIIGFDPKSSAAMSKFTSIKAFLKGVEAWKKETAIRREAKAKQLEQSNEDTRYTLPPTGPDTAAETKKTTDEAVSIWKNIYWKEFGLLASVWVAFLTLQVTKNYVATCSTWYWVLTVLQIPVSVGVSMYQAAGLVQGKRALSSRANNQTSPKAHQILVYCFFGVTAGVLAGLLGVGGGVVMGPLFLELGIHPRVSSATASFAMMFSSSMAAVEYYLLKRFPVPYALFFTGLTFVAAIVGQWVARKLVNWLGRASFIIFILSSMIFVSAISLGGVGVSKTTHKMARHEYMGFGNICNYHA